MRPTAAVGSAVTTLSHCQCQLDMQVTVSRQERNFWKFPAVGRRSQERWQRTCGKATPRPNISHPSLHQQSSPNDALLARHFGSAERASCVRRRLPEPAISSPRGLSECRRLRYSVPGQLQNRDPACLSGDPPHHLRSQLYQSKPLSVR
jgi:hypothetical protein